MRYGLYLALCLALLCVGITAGSDLVVHASTEEKTLNVYGCTTVTPTNAYQLPMQICKIYEPETHKRYLIAYGSKGESFAVAIQPID